ncbi:MAG: hypothetical protein JXA79_04585 [Deltaproteobacteria bacterium]|nr:hypothetical protein [Deltaproteobacteria bacterium]
MYCKVSKFPQAATFPADKKRGMFVAVRNPDKMFARKRMPDYAFIKAL